MGFLRIGLASSLSRSLFIRPLSVESIVGFPLRIRAFNGASSINLYRTAQNAEAVEYVSDDGLTYGYWNFIENFGEFYLDNGNVLISAPTLASVPTSWPSTGWGEGWQFGVASPTLVTLSYASPQSFAYSNSVPSIVFTSSPAIASNLFAISGLSSVNVGTQNAVISLERADYYLANPITIPVTITKKNVTLSINNQSSTYSPNATYNWFSAVGISTLAAGDTIQSGFNSNLLTGVPATNANAGSYTISFNPNYTSANYNITNSPASATWTIGKANQTISFNPSGTALTTDSTNLSASSTSGLSVSFSVVSGPATLNGSTLTYSGAGSVVVRASQAGNTNYNAATNVDRTITVSAPAGGGIVVANTSQIRITFANNVENWIANGNTFVLDRLQANLVLDDSYYDENGNYIERLQQVGPNRNYKYLASNHFDLIPPNNISSTQYGIQPNSSVNYWRLYLNSTSCSDGQCGLSYVFHYENPSTDPTIIPTSGWSSSPPSYGSSIVSITAVNSGIPVASTNSINITGYYYGGGSGTFIRKNIFNQFIGNMNGNADTGYMGNGVAYVNINYGIDFALLAPNSNIMDGPDPAGNWISPRPNWTIHWIYSDDGTRSEVVSENPSTDPTIIPTAGWSPSITITAA